MNVRSKRIKADAVQHFVPRDRHEVELAVAEIGELDRQISQLEIAMNDGKAAIELQAKESMQPIKAARDEKAKGVRLWCEANRFSLTDGGIVKTAVLETGVIKWRFTPPKVADVPRPKLPSVLDALRNLPFGSQFIRVTEALNKDAVLSAVRDNPEVESKFVEAGLRITQKEEFVIIPNNTELDAGEELREVVI